jgi:hypothetical protein
MADGKWQIGNGMLDGGLLSVRVLPVKSSSQQFAGNFALWYYFTQMADRCLRLR